MDEKNISVLSGRVSRSDELEALAARCEREEPSARLDDAIFVAVGCTVGDPVAYTASISAAVMLMPSDYIWDVTSTGTAWCMPDTLGEQFIGSAATPALALCAVALRARAATKTES